MWVKHIISIIVPQITMFTKGDINHVQMGGLILCTHIDGNYQPIGDSKPFIHYGGPAHEWKGINQIYHIIEAFYGIGDIGNDSQTR